MSDQRAGKSALGIEPYLDRLFRSAYRLTQDRADAEELVQDTCVCAFTKGKRWVDASSPLAWLMRVQYNLFVDSVRQRARDSVIPLSEADHPNLAADDRFDPEFRAEESQHIARVQRAWQKLNRDQRALLALRAEGFTLAEMREITGFSIEVLNARLQRARQSLTRYLKQDDAVAQARQQMEVQR